jgi:hypothetical protein
LMFDSLYIISLLNIAGLFICIFYFFFLI